VTKERRLAGPLLGRRMREPPVCTWLPVAAESKPLEEGEVLVRYLGVSAQPAS
jgi:hypothetical protein